MPNDDLLTYIEGNWSAATFSMLVLLLVPDKDVRIG